MTSSIFLLAMTRPTNRMFVQLVVELTGDERIRPARRGARSRARPAARRCAGKPSASRSCRLNSESPSARSQRSTYALQLAPAAEALAGQRAVDADEVLGRRDVVVDERHAIGQRVRRPRRLRPDREMVQQQVVGMAGVDQLAVVARQRLEPAIGGLDEDVRLVAGARGAPAGCRALRGRWRRRSRAWRAPGGRPVAAACASGAASAGAAARTATMRTAPLMVRCVRPPVRRSRRPAQTRRASTGGVVGARLRDGSGPIAGPGGNCRDDLAPRRAVGVPPFEPARQRLERAARRRRRQALDACRGTCARSPASRSARGRTAVRSGRGVPLSHAVVLDGAQRLDELLPVVVVEAGVAADALALAARRIGRWRAPACRAPTPRAPPSTGSRSTTA